MLEQSENNLAEEKLQLVGEIDGEPAYVPSHPYGLIVDFSKKRYYHPFTRGFLLHILEKSENKEADSLVIIETEYDEVFSADNNTKLMFK